MKETLDLTKVPKHIAIIMDGNGRWAKKKGAMRIFGHRHAIQAVKDAQCELSLALYSGTYQPNTDSRITEKQMDGVTIRREFSGRQPGALPPSVKNLVRDLLNDSQRVRG
jgi:hypothetical protein